MAIVLISSLYQGGRDELAEVLARKTNWPVLNREEAQEKARKLGIKVGRLEISVMKMPGWSEKLAREKDVYLAFITAILCEKAREGDLIYTGRAGHLMLPGVSHRLRVGLTAQRETRVKRTAKALNLTLDKAESCLAQLDEDIEKWIHWVHHVDNRNPENFDAFFNLENMSLSNVAGVVCSMATLPDFQPTPASTRTLDNLYLSSQAKLRLALNERTDEADLQIHAEDGVITVMYPPHQSGVSEHIPRVLADLEGCRGIQCTMAETNILWIQERFKTESENFKQIVDLAQRWGAAVELLRPIPSTDALDYSANHDSTGGNGFGPVERPSGYDGGVEDDEPAADRDDGGLDKTEEELIGLGRYGGRHTVSGEYDKLLDAVHGKGNYSLVVIGDMFLSKGHSTRTRRTRELAMAIRDRLKAPVITADELKSRFLFGKRQAVILAGFLILVFFIYAGVFTKQKQVLDFLSGPIHERYKWLAPAVLVLFVPFVAYVYGKVAELTLKIIRID
jgi:cytidylate kinase